MEHVVRFLNSVGALAHDADLYMGEFVKSLTDQAYAGQVNIKASSLRDWHHFVSLCNTKFSVPKRNLLLPTLVEHVNT